MLVRRLAPALLVVALALAGCESKVDVTVNTPPPAGDDAPGQPDDAAGADAGQVQDTTPPKNRGAIGFSALNLGNPFFEIIADHLTAEAKQHGFEVVVENADSDVKSQAEHIDAFIAKKVTAIVLNPCDRLSIGPAIKKANEAGIPVFTCDLQCVAPEAKVVAHVGTDNFGGGKLAGEAMIEALGEAGGEVYVLHFPQANSCVLRVQGFQEVIDAHNQGREKGRITVVGVQDGGGEPNKGFATAAAAVQAHPSLAGIFAINDPSALGAYTALVQAGKTDQVTIVAFDGQKEGKQAIKEGKIYADPIQFPDKMGRLTMQNIVKYLSGEEFEPVTLIPTVLYRKADADKDPELD